MSTRDSGGVGMNHLTVVPENLETEPAADEEPARASDKPEATMDGDGA
jgi:hypothetical protein